MATVSDTGNQFRYVEGFAADSEFDFGGFEHAWCMLDGAKLVDITRPFDYYHGVIVTDDDTLRHYTSEQPCSYGFIDNYRDRFQYLRERGFIDE